LAKITLIVGGSRSGKSDYARRRAESLPGPRLFVATCPPLDEEMRARIADHRLARSASEWDTIEEFGDLIAAIERATGKYQVILVDCLTLWLNNLMNEANADGREMTEKDIALICEQLVRTCARLSGSVLFIANEVGMGIVPDNRAARRFRDLAGRCNQVMAGAADEVVLVSCGIPLFLKGGGDGAA
jgi:adenosylcobinamide kinase/adenosylcobinamide-phosphate guanylyltransferase